MHSKALFVAFVCLVTTALAAADPAPYKLGAVSLPFNNAFGLDKRQEGYQPTSYNCGTGDTCEIACGSGSVQCTSNDARMHCFTPANQTCCPNLSGHACDKSYYCTQDSKDETWCCPNGMDLATCAAQYKVSTLVSLSGSATATGASAPTALTPATITASSTVGAETDLTTTSYSVPTGTNGLNYTVPTATATIGFFTGAASKHYAYGVSSAFVLGLACLIAAV